MQNISNISNINTRWPNWWVVLVFLAAVLVFHPVSQYFTYRRGQHLNNKILLPDLLHELLPDNYHKARMGDYLAGGIFILFLIQAIRLKEWEHLFDWFKIMAFVYLFKSLTMMVTTLPDSRGECNYSFINLGGCNDLIFSGHTAFIATSVFFLTLMVPASLIPLLYTYLVVAMYFIITSRNHYTVDVLLGLYISYTMFLLRDRF